MSSITFPSEQPQQLSESSTTASHYEGFFGSPYNPSSSFQINPLSAHPPRTPKSSIHVHSHSHSNSQIRYRASEDGTELSQYTSLEKSVYESDFGGSETSANGAQDKTQVEEILIEEHDDDEEDEPLALAEDVAGVSDAVAARVKPPVVLREILKTSTGRDKAFKVMQYSIRLYLLFHSTLGATRLFSLRNKNPLEMEMIRRLEATSSGLSTVRKCLIMFNWLTPLTSILAREEEDVSLTGSSKKSKDEPPKPLLRTFLHAPPPILLDFVNGLSDDIYAFYRLGLIGKKTGERAAQFSDWCWFAATLIALAELSFERNVTKSKMKSVESKMYSASMTGATEKSNSAYLKRMEKELEVLKRQDYWLRIQRTKLLLDLVFVSYDLFKVKYARDTVRTFAGLGAALLSSAKLYYTHRSTLILKQIRH